MTALRAILSRPELDEVVLRITAVVMMVYGAQSETLEALLVVLGGAGLVFPALLRRGAYWWLAVGLSVSLHALKWYMIDNHKYLLCYWLVGCALAVGRPAIEDTLARTGRSLIGLCFACGLFWKLFGGQYVDGSFMHYTLLASGKFAPAAGWLGGLEPSQLLETKVLLRLLEAGLVNAPTVGLTTSDGVASAALFSSYFTLVIEASLAVTFLLGDRLRPGWRHGLLLLFIVTVYPFAMVPGFACILVTLALADVGGSSTLRLTYLAVLVFSVLSFIPQNVGVHLGLLVDFFSW